jgi:hypothetical protein
MARAKRRTVIMAGLGAGACALVLGVAGIASASTQTGHIYSSNGEAGYYTWSPTAFNENYAFVTPTAIAEQMGANGGIGLQLAALSTGNIYKQSVGQECSVAQVGLVWNNTEGAFDVVAGEGTIEYNPSITNVDNGTTNPDACTTGGALSDTGALADGQGHEDTTPVSVDSDGYVATTSDSEVILTGIPAGDQVYLNELRIGSGEIKFTAYDADASFNSGEVTLANHIFSGPLQPHFAGAGTVFDLTNRGPAVQSSADMEASFYLLRAGQWTNHHGHFGTSVNVYNAWLAQEVQSSANGEASDPPAITPFNTLNNPFGGIFDLYVGVPVGP